MNNKTKLQPTMDGTRLPPDFKQVRKYMRTARQREPKVYAVTPRIGLCRCFQTKTSPKRHCSPCGVVAYARDLMMGKSSEAKPPFKTGTSILKSITVKPTPRKHSAKEAPILRRYLLEALKDSNANPPDTEYQRGFLGALLVLFEDLCMTESEREQHLIIETAMKDCRQADSTGANRSRRRSPTRSGARTTK